MNQLDEEGLINLLSRTKGANIITLTTYTKVTNMRAKVDGARNPYYQKTNKLSQVNGVIGFWYERNVNNRREKEDKEPNFEAMPHLYARPIVQGCCILKHREDDRLYVPINIRSRKDIFYVDNEEVDADIIKAWSYEKPEGFRQGLDNTLIYRNFSPASIIGITLNHEQYIINHDDIMVQA